MFYNNKFYYTTFLTANMGINRRKRKGEIPGQKLPLPKGKTEPSPEVLRRRARQNRRYHARKAEQAQAQAQAQPKLADNLDFIVEGDLSPEDIDSLMAEAGLNEPVAKQEPVPKRVYKKKRKSFAEVLKMCSTQFHAGKMSTLVENVLSDGLAYKEMARLLLEEDRDTEDDATKALGPDVLRDLIV